jgi:hypothetical protein
LSQRCCCRYKHKLSTISPGDVLRGEKFIEYVALQVLGADGPNKVKVGATSEALCRSHDAQGPAWHMQARLAGRTAAGCIAWQQAP